MLDFKGRWSPKLRFKFLDYLNDSRLLPPVSFLIELISLAIPLCSRFEFYQNSCAVVSYEDPISKSNKDKFLGIIDFVNMRPVNYLSILLFLTAYTAFAAPSPGLNAKTAEKHNASSQKQLIAEKREIQGSNGDNNDNNNDNNSDNNENEAEAEDGDEEDDFSVGLPTDQTTDSGLMPSLESETDNVTANEDDENMLPRLPFSLGIIVDQQARYMAMMQVQRGLYDYTVLAIYLRNEIPYLSVQRAERIAEYVTNAILSMDASGRPTEPAIDRVLNAQFDTLELPELEQQMDEIISFISRNLNLANGPRIGDVNLDSIGTTSLSPYERLTKLAENQARLLAILRVRRGTVNKRVLAVYLRQQDPFLGFEDATEMAETIIEDYAPLDQQVEDENEPPAFFGRLRNWWSRMRGSGDDTDTDAVTNDEEEQDENGMDTVNENDDDDN